MARVGRGALVGLPAVGALFVAHLAHQDWHRLAEERAAGKYVVAVTGHTVLAVLWQCNKCGSGSPGLHHHHVMQFMCQCF